MPKPYFFIAQAAIAGWLESDDRSKKRVGLQACTGIYGGTDCSSAPLRIGLARGAERPAVRSRQGGTPFTQGAGGVFASGWFFSSRAKTMTATKPGKPRRGAKIWAATGFFTGFFFKACKKHRQSSQEQNRSKCMNCDKSKAMGREHLAEQAIL